MTTWQLQTAKAKLSELLRAVRQQGPQIISVRGKEEFVVSLKQEAPVQRPAPRTWDELVAPVQGLGDDLALPTRNDRVREEPAPFAGPDEK